jgi:gliding motility-associated-like protein
VSAVGAYSVKITDTNGCTNRSPVANVAIFASPVAEAIAFSGALIRCAGDTVTLTANPAGFSYAWLNTAPVVNTRDLKVTTSGSFSVVITNGNGCSDTSTTVTTVFNALPAKPIITSPNTSVCQPSSLEFSTDAGFTYDWTITGITPNPSTQTVTINTAGAYDAKVTITDANNCKNVSDLFFGTVKKVPLPPSIVSAAGDLSVCEGDSIILKPQPFFAASNYTWTPGALVADSFVVKAPGALSLSVAVDSNGCASIGSSSLAVNVNARPATPIVTVAQGNAAFCSGDSAVLTSGSAFGYLWTPGGINTQTLTAKTTGLYSVVTLSDSGCASLPSSQISIESRKNPEKPLVNATKTSFCFGDNSILSVTNVRPGNTYTWSPSGSGPILTVTASGNYSVKSDSTNGCSSTSDEVAILVKALPEVVVTTTETDNRVCIGDSVVLTSNFEAGNVWNGVPGSPVTKSITLKSTTSAITLKVTDASGCTNTVGPISVKVDTLPIVTLEQDTALIVKEAFELTASGYPTNRQKFDWYKGGLFIGTTDGSDPNFEITASNTSNYAVLITDSNGCTASDSVLIRVSTELFVPNSFSPNNDGKNDRFKVYGYGVATIEVKVWDRLGNLVYETNKVEDIVETSEDNDSAIGWDGKFKGQEVSQESYIWKVTGTFNTGEPVRVFGGYNSGSVIILN